MNSPWSTALLLCGLICVASCKSSPRRENDNDLEPHSPFQTGHLKPPTSDVGPNYEDDDFELQFVRRETCKPSPPFLPEAGRERWSVELRIRSKSERAVPVQTLAFHLRDKSGHYFSATLAGCRPPLKTETLSGGRIAHGNVAFDVPQGQDVLELVYEPFLVGRPKVEAVVRAH